MEGHLACVEYLVMNGVPVEIKTTQGLTALAYARQQGHGAVTEYLEAVIDDPGVAQCTLDQLQTTALNASLRPIRDDEYFSDGDSSFWVSDDSQFFVFCLSGRERLAGSNSLMDTVACQRPFGGQ